MGETEQALLLSRVASGDQAAELDAVFHQSDSFVNFFAKVAEDGVQAALAQRRKQFG